MISINWCVFQGLPESTGRLIIGAEVHDYKVQLKTGLMKCEGPWRVWIICELLEEQVTAEMAKNWKTQPCQVQKMVEKTLDDHQHRRTTTVSSRADNLVLVKLGFSALSIPRFFGV